MILGLLGGWFSIFPNPSLAQLAKSAFEKKDYKNAARLSREYLSSAYALQLDDPILEIYFKTESNLSRLEEYLEKLHPHSSEPKFLNLVYYLVEKCYQAKEVQIGEKWGEVLLTEGGESPYYAKGILVYSGILYLKEDKQKAKQILKNPTLAHSKGIWKKRLNLLKLALKKEEKIILTANRFLSKNQESPYADFVIALIIESYKKLGEEQKAREWSKQLEKNFPKSVFVSQI